MLFGVFVAKDQRNNQTQNADCPHHSQNGWDAESTLYDRQDEDTEGRSDLRNTSREAAGGARNCVGNRIGARVNVVALGPAFINKSNRMNPENTSGMCKLEFDS